MLRLPSLERSDVGSDDIDDDKRNVILLAHGTGPPFPELGEQLVRQLGRRLRLIIWSIQQLLS